MFPLPEGISVLGTFQIAALPRSGTAWFATALNTCSKIMAYHEGVTIDIGDSNDHLKYDYIGDCSSEILLSGFEADVKIAIARDPEDCFESVRHCGIHLTEDQKEGIVELYNKRTLEASWVIPYEELFKYSTVYSTIAKIDLNGDLDIDYLKFMQLSRMNVQLNEIDYSVAKISNKVTEKYQNI